MNNLLICQAILLLNPSVVNIIDFVAYDINGQEVTYDRAAAEAYAASKEYINKRQAEYPPMTDYLDAIVKSDEEQKQAYITACLAVKAKYPK